MGTSCCRYMRLNKNYAVFGTGACDSSSVHPEFSDSEKHRMSVELSILYHSGTHFTISFLHSVPEHSHQCSDRFFGIVLQVGSGIDKIIIISTKEGDRVIRPGDFSLV